MSSISTSSSQNKAQLRAFHKKTIKKPNISTLFKNPSQDNLNIFEKKTLRLLNYLLTSENSQEKDFFEKNGVVCEKVYKSIKKAHPHGLTNSYIQSFYTLEKRPNILIRVDYENDKINCGEYIIYDIENMVINSHTFKLDNNNIVFTHHWSTSQSDGENVIKHFYYNVQQIDYEKINCIQEAAGLKMSRIQYRDLEGKDILRTKDPLYFHNQEIIPTITPFSTFEESQAFVPETRVFSFSWKDEFSRPISTLDVYCISQHVPFPNCIALKGYIHEATHSPNETLAIKTQTFPIKLETPQVIQEDPVYPVIEGAVVTKFEIVNTKIKNKMKSKQYVLELQFNNYSKFRGILSGKIIEGNLSIQEDLDGKIINLEGKFQIEDKKIIGKELRGNRSNNIFYSNIQTCNDNILSGIIEFCPAEDSDAFKKLNIKSIKGEVPTLYSKQLKVEFKGNYFFSGYKKKQENFFNGILTKNSEIFKLNYQGTFEVELNDTKMVEINELQKKFKLHTGTLTITKSDRIDIHTFDNNQLSESYVLIPNVGVKYFTHKEGKEIEGFEYYYNSNCNIQNFKITKCHQSGYPAQGILKFKNGQVFAGDFFTPALTEISHSFKKQIKAFYPYGCPYFGFALIENKLYFGKLSPEDKKYLPLKDGNYNLKITPLGAFEIKIPDVSKEDELNKRLTYTFRTHTTVVDYRFNKIKHADGSFDYIGDIQISNFKLTRVKIKLGKFDLTEANYEELTMNQVEKSIFNEKENNSKSKEKDDHKQIESSITHAIKRTIPAISGDLLSLKDQNIIDFIVPLMKLAKATIKEKYITELHFNHTENEVSFSFIDGKIDPKTGEIIKSPSKFTVIKKGCTYTEEAYVLSGSLKNMKIELGILLGDYFTMGKSDIRTLLKMGALIISIEDINTKKKNLLPFNHPSSIIGLNSTLTIDFRGCASGYIMSTKSGNSLKFENMIFDIENGNIIESPKIFFISTEENSLSEKDYELKGSFYNLRAIKIC